MEKLKTFFKNNKVEVFIVITSDSKGTTWYTKGVGVLDQIGLLEITKNGILKKQDEREKPND
jgi:hypothetical protein